MLLSPEAIELLNAHCVVFTLNVMPTHPAERRELERLRAWAAKDAPQLSRLLAERVDIGPYLIGPDGQILKQVSRLDQVLDDVQAVAKQAGIQPGKRVSNASLAWFRDWKPGDMGLKLTARFLPSKEARLPAPAPWRVPMVHTVGTEAQNERMYRARFTSPTRDGVVLRPEQVRHLLPPGAEVREWEIPADTAKTLLWLFRPSTHQYLLSLDDVREVRLRAVSAGPGRALLEGRARIRHWWFPRRGEGMWLGDQLAEDYWADSPVKGYMDYGGGKVKSVKLVTDGAVYRGRDGTSLPFEAALYSVDEAEARAGCAKPSVP